MKVLDARGFLSEGVSAEQPLVLRGRQLVAHMTGALYWPGERLLVVADLHLEKGSARAERGSFLPPYDTRTTLGRLAQVIERYDPDRVVALGDSLHDRGAAARLLPDDLDLIQALQAGRSWHWVTGNHDPEIPDCLAGERCGGLELGGLILQHIPYEGVRSDEIAGHLHPAARLSHQGYSVRRPCFVSDGQRLILPAFGAYAGGLNILDPAFAAILGGGGLKVWMIGYEGVYPVPARQLAGD